MARSSRPAPPTGKARLTRGLVRVEPGGENGEPMPQPYRACQEKLTEREKVTGGQRALPRAEPPSTAVPLGGESRCRRRRLSCQAKFCALPCPQDVRGRMSKREAVP